LSFSSLSLSFLVAGLLAVSTVCSQQIRQNLECVYTRLEHDDKFGKNNKKNNDNLLIASPVTKM
jgi:hypothetical protein